MFKEPAIPPITQKTLSSYFTSWLKNIENGELTFIEAYPGSDAHRRARNFKDGMFLPKQFNTFFNQYYIVLLDLRIEIFDTIDELEFAIIEQIIGNVQAKKANYKSFTEFAETVFKTDKKKIALFVLGSEKIIHEQKIYILRWFESMRSMNAAQSLLFFECDLFSAKSIQILSKIPTLQPRFTTLKLYDSVDSRQFIEYLQSKLNIKLSSKQISEIIIQCGGLMKLMKVTLSHLRDYPNTNLAEIFQMKEMKYNISLVFENLQPEEKEVLKSIARGIPSSYENKEVIEYLVRTGFIVNKNDSLEIAIPLLQRHLKEIDIQDKTLSLNNGQLTLNMIPVDLMFSKIERALLSYFIAHPNVLISRDQLAEIIWKEQADDKYSDWAIDSHISRLRKRLKSLGMRETSITTKKKQGFIYFNKS